MAEKVWRRGQRGLKTDTAHERGTQTRFGGGRPKRTQSGHQDRRRTHSGQGLEAQATQGGKADTLAGGHMADKSRTRFGGVANADSRRTHGGHITDKLQGRGQRIWRPNAANLFFS